MTAQINIRTNTADHPFGTDTSVDTDSFGPGDTPPTSGHSPKGRRPGRWVVPAAAAMLLVGVGATVVVTNDDGGNTVSSTSVERADDGTAQRMIAESIQDALSDRKTVSNPSAALPESETAITGWPWRLDSPSSAVTTGGLSQVAPTMSAQRMIEASIAEALAETNSPYTTSQRLIDESIEQARRGESRFVPTSADAAARRAEALVPAPECVNQQPC